MLIRAENLFAVVSQPFYKYLVRGDPEKHDNYGNTGLHLASAKGHLNCVTFLINFGVNIWDLDIDMHSAKDLAAINNREDILKYLDSAGAQQEANNPKLAKSSQEKAKKRAGERMKNFQKLQKKAEKTASKENEKIEKRRQSLHPDLLATVSGRAGGAGADRRPSLGVTAFSTLTGRGGGGEGGGQHRYSDLLGTVASRKPRGGVMARIQQRRERVGEGGAGENFTVREGGGTVRSITGQHLNWPVCDFFLLFPVCNQVCGRGRRSCSETRRWGR